MGPHEACQAAYRRVYNSFLAMGAGGGMTLGIVKRALSAALDDPCTPAARGPAPHQLDASCTGMESPLAWLALSATTSSRRKTILDWRRLPAQKWLSLSPTTTAHMFSCGLY